MLKVKNIKMIREGNIRCEENIYGVHDTPYVWQIDFEDGNTTTMNTCKCGKGCRTLLQRVPSIGEEFENWEQFWDNVRR